MKNKTVRTSNLLAGLFEAMMILHFWLSGVCATAGFKWNAMGMLVGGYLWMIFARQQRRHAAVIESITATAPPSA